MNEYEVSPIILDTQNKESIVGNEDLQECRRMMYEFLEPENGLPVSIYILAYNRLDKTRYCVECVLNYTKEFDFELILADNGSDDGTYEYFQSVPWKKKKIIRVTKNVGSLFPWGVVKQIYSGKYLVCLANDVYVTKNWLSNLLRCLESDPRIGFVMPVSSNVSNLQQVELPFQTMEEMQQLAAEFNQSDPRKWEERLRLITIVSIYTKELIDQVGMPDYGFFHNFGEDDYAARIRRAGYRLMLCKDTYVHHDHSLYGRINDYEFQRSLLLGRNMFKKKYYGIDAWDDITNYETVLIGKLDPDAFSTETIHALAIDARCGTPILEIRNRFRKSESEPLVISHAFTTNAKYYAELRQQADDVFCDRIEFIQEHYLNDTMDIIFLGEPINLYDQPIGLVQKLLGLLKKGGQMLLKLRNVNDYRKLLSCLELDHITDPDMPVQLPMNEFNNCLELFDVKSVDITSEFLGYTDESLKQIYQFLELIGIQQIDTVWAELATGDYLYYIVK